MEETNKQQKQESITVSPEILLTQIVNSIGEEFVVVPTSGWMQIVKTIQEYSKDKDDDNNLTKILEELSVPIIPVSLSPEHDEKRIITPNDIPKGDSKIIIP